jgi:hypothetical protein
VNLSGSVVYFLQMNAYGVRPLSAFNLRPKLSALMNRGSATREFGAVISQLVVAVEAFNGHVLDGAMPLPPSWAFSMPCQATGNGLLANRERDALNRTSTWR